MEKQMIMPYFPYGVKVVHNKNYNNIMTIKVLHDKYYEAHGLWNNVERIPYESDLYRMALHPLTYDYLTTPIKINCRFRNVADLFYDIIYKHTPTLKRCDDSSWLAKLIVAYFDNTGICPFPRIIMSEIYRLLFALHFDVFDYIGRPDVVDISTLPYNPYEYDHHLL